MKTKVSRGIFILIVLLVVGSGLLFASGSKEKETAKFVGKTLRVMVFNHTYFQALKDFLPEFEAQTGMKVELESPSFPVYNQRADLELAGATGAYDVLTMTFIYCGKWIEAGWATDLAPFIKDPKLTDKSFDAEDFMAGAVSPFKRGKSIYALPWVAESTLMVYRKDIYDNHGVTVPKTFEELLSVAKKINSKDVVAYLGRGKNAIHWIYPNFLMAYGGNFFVNPLADMTPAFDSEAAIESAEIMVKLYRDYGFPDALNINDDEAVRRMGQGKAATWIDALAWVGAVADPKRSDVYEKISYALPPGGPAGQFPQLALHGLLIPAAAKRKEASWEFIKWALSRDVMMKIITEIAYPAVTRASIVSDPIYKKKYKWGGVDIGALHMGVLKLASTGYMTYRTIPEFPPIGGSVNIAIGEIFSGQKTASQAMKDCNRDVADILTKAGYKIRK